MWVLIDIGGHICSQFNECNVVDVKEKETSTVIVEFAIATTNVNV